MKDRWVFDPEPLIRPAPRAAPDRFAYVLAVIVATVLVTAVVVALTWAAVTYGSPFDASDPTAPVEPTVRSRG